jgi:hypothetical protein
MLTQIKVNQIRVWGDTKPFITIDGNTFVVVDLFEDLKIKIRYLKSGLTLTCEYYDILVYSKEVEEINDEQN